MPRQPRLFIPGATYHVYCRVARGEFVFDDDLEAIEFIETPRQVRDLGGWSVLAWCLMGNHYHLVVKARTVDLWRSMARLQGRVSRSYNRRHRFLGRLWQSRYRARVVDTDEDYRRVVAYGHLNPVSSGIVHDPADHVYSGIKVSAENVMTRTSLRDSTVSTSRSLGDGNGATVNVAPSSAGPGQSRLSRTPRPPPAGPWSRPPEMW
jgi:putative transposase